MRRKSLSFLLLIIILFSFSTGQYGCECGDTTPPTVQITEPGNGATVSGIVTIQAIAYDKGGIAKVEFYVNNNKIGQSYSSPYYCNWDTDTLTYNSQHTIQAKAYDNAGNVGVSSTITVTIGDNLAPTVSITNPQNGATVSGTVTIQVSVTERTKKALSGINRVEFYIDGNYLGVDSSSPYEYNWNTNSVSNGNHTVMAKAYDNAGNIGTASITVNVQNQQDTIPPSVSITYPTNGQNVYGTVIIQVTASDNVGVTKVEFYINGNKVGEDYNSPYQYEWNTDILTYNSQHTIQAKAYDNAGNVGVSSTITVTIGDNLAPTVSITNPQNGATVSGTVTIQVSVTERTKKALSGINRVEFYIDGNYLGVDSSSPYEYNWDTNSVSNGNHTIMAKAYDNAGNVGTASIIVNVQNQPSQAKWTFMVFMNGDNDLEDYANLDLNEMKTVGSTNDVNIIVQLDRYSTTGAWRYKVLQNNLQEIWSTTSELDFGSPDTLKDFVIWTINNYPADRYALIIWDHGAGWRRKTLGLRGISYDETSDTIMTMAQLKSALSQVGRKIDLLGMDACLMAMMEVAYQVKDYADYLVGSEESEPGYGWPYNTILTELVSNPNMGPSTLAPIIVNKYSIYYSFWSDVTQSAIDLSKIGDLKNACDSLALTLKNNMNTYKTQIQQAVANTETYSYTDFRDLYHFAQNIYNNISDTTIRNLATNVMNKVSSAVISEWHSSDLANSHGISIWLPPSSLYYNYLSNYQSLDFAINTQWDEFLGALYSTP